jgi:hypothetical protein
MLFTRSAHLNSSLYIVINYFIAVITNHSHQYTPLMNHSHSPNHCSHSLHFLMTIMQARYTGQGPDHVLAYTIISSLAYFYFKDHFYLFFIKLLITNVYFIL